MIKYSFKPNDLVFKLYTVNILTDELEFYRNLRFSDIVSSQIETNKIETNFLEIEFQHKSDYIELILLSQVKPIVIERLIYQQPDELTTVTAQYNPIFFMSYELLAESQDNENTYKIQALDWKGYIEDRTVIEHNVVYLPNNLPSDDEGNPYFPDDFNKIKYPNVDKEGVFPVATFEEILIDIYRRNIGLRTDLPFGRNKGTAHLPDIDRTCSAFDGLLINISGFGNYKTLQEKKTILAFKSVFYDYFKSNNGSDVYNVETKILNNKIKVVYNVPTPINIDNFTSKDEPISYSIEKNDTEVINSVVVESGSEDFYYEIAKDLKINQIKTFESLESGNSDETDTESMGNQAIGALKAGQSQTVTSIEIEFKEKEFLKDIKVGAVITLENFNPLINGKYQITKINEIIEDEYVTYSFENERIENVLHT